MCDRYSLGVDMETVSEDEEVVQIAWQLEPMSYVIPGRRSPVLLRRGDRLTVTLGSWGLGGLGRSRCGEGSGELVTQIPFDPEGTMPEWIRGLQPCAIPADGFIGTAHSTPEMAWRIGRPNGRIFWMAGLWKAGVGELDSSFTLLTAPQYLSGVGFIERAPVILVGASAPGWLSPRESCRNAPGSMPPNFLRGTPVTEHAGLPRDREQKSVIGTW